MGESGGFNEDNKIDLPGGSFSKLLLSVDDVAAKRSSSFHAQNSPFFSSNTPKMLCFGDFGHEMSHISSSFVGYSDTSCASSCGDAISMLDNKRNNGPGQETGLGSESTQNNGRKRNKPEMGPTNITTTNPTSSVGHAKGRKVKLGERIAALHQLVCPYGKTDTASVLHEAIGYIRFLHDQVKVLSSPYMQRVPSSSSPQQHHLSMTEKSEPISTYDTTKCLRSRGLCLVPVDCIVDIANSNGADFWSSVTSLSTS